MLRAGSHNYTCLLLVKKTIKLYYNYIVQVFMLRAGSHNYTCLLLVKKTIKL